MELIKKYFPKLEKDQLEKLIALEALYVDWNAKINVISRKNMDQFYCNHVLHSLAIPQFYDISKHKKVLDIGTGGGFPGIPLAIVYPDIQFHLVDSIAKKIKVIDAVVEALQLTNVTTEVNRFEQVEETYSCIVSRAVAPAFKLVNFTKQATAKGTEHVFLKGGDLLAERDELWENHPKASWDEYKLADKLSEDFFETKKLVVVRDLV